MTRSAIRGYLDYVRDNEVVGWAVDETDIDRKLHIFPYLDDEPFESGIANLERLDVLAAGIATAACGFQLNITQALKVRPEARIVTVRASAGAMGDLVVLGSYDLKAVSKASDDERPLDGNANERSAEMDSAPPLRTLIDETSELTSGRAFETFGAENLGVSQSTDLPMQTAQVKAAEPSPFYEADCKTTSGGLDPLDGNVLTGWAVYNDDIDTPVVVRARIKDCDVAYDLACRERPDVSVAGRGISKCGFALDLTNIIRARPLGSEIKLEVFAAAQYLEPIGTVSLDEFHGLFPNAADNARWKRSFISIATRTIGDALTARRERDKELPFFPASSSHLPPGPAPAVYQSLLSPSAVPSTVRQVCGSRFSQLSGYVDYVRYRYKVNNSFKIGLNEKDFSDYLRWYVDVYLKLRSWRRAPLPKSELDYLGEPGPILPANRVMCYYLQAWRNSCSPIEGDERLSVSYWWAVELAPTLYVEDCLVPQWCVDTLRCISDRWKDKLFPLNAFMEVYFSRVVELHFIDMETVPGRVLFYAFLILNSSKRPDLLRFLPQDELEYLLSNMTEGERPRIEVIFERFGIRSSLFTLSWLRNMAASLMFDLDKRAFATLSADGHRLASNAMPIPAADDFVDVQVIGPFQKASGLGQAARLSASMISRAGYSVNLFDHGLDNPAPEGYSSTVRIGDLKTSRINLFHLNGESVPVAFAYMPPIMADSYNIGYFYWELDTPAACHYLALDLLDEIWVSSEYCRQTYARFTSKPVINVGMCAETVDCVSRSEARSFVQDRFGYTSSDFVFLAAFDSFSFVQRKNPVAVVRAFKAAFPNDPHKRLMLKTHNRHRVDDPQQAKIWQAVDEEALTDPRIAIVNETLSYNSLRKLKAGVDCYVSLHRSEGWGFGLIESMASGTPVVTTGYSGNMDFCNSDNSWLVEYEEEFLSGDDYIFVVPGQKWAEPVFESAVFQMRSVASNPLEREHRANAACEFIRTKFSESAIAKRYGSRLREILSSRTGASKSS